MPTANSIRTTQRKVDLFRSFFSGLPHVYGTYDPHSGRSWQVKNPVTTETILAHLKGKRHYGVYLLVEDIIRATVADFDHHDPTKPLEFIRAANHYRISAYLEISKSKGFHVWIFFGEKGVRAYKARLVVQAMLAQIDACQTEVFPKQDILDSKTSFGNFIYTPLFGRLVPEGRTVFADTGTLEPFENQWDFLESVHRVEETLLDEIIEINNLSTPNQVQTKTEVTTSSHSYLRSAALPICIQSMLQNGVTRLQRSSCFRLAIQLRKIGLPLDATISVLRTWSMKNRPEVGKRIITTQEITEQASCAYRNYYQAYGCETPEIAIFCDSACPLYAKRVKRG